MKSTLPISDDTHGLSSGYKRIDLYALLAQQKLPCDCVNNQSLPSDIINLINKLLDDNIDIDVIMHNDNSLSINSDNYGTKLLDLADKYHMSPNNAVKKVLFGEIKVAKDNIDKSLDRICHAITSLDNSNRSHALP